jgi:hypothetical protein
MSNVLPLGSSSLREVADRARSEPLASWSRLGKPVSARRHRKPILEPAVEPC